MRRAECIVVGCSGAHGSSALYQLAKRKVKVIGIDAHRGPHPKGSSHGETRITRLSCGEGEKYPLLSVRSLAIWRELEAFLGAPDTLLRQCGGIIIGPKEGAGDFHGKSDFWGTTLDLARRYRIRHWTLSAEELRSAFPFNVDDDEIGYYEPQAGILFPEKCVAANLAAASRLGAQMLTGKVQYVQQFGDEVQVLTSEGVVSAKQCIITAGPFVREFLPTKYHKYFTVHRQPLFWFLPKDAAALRSHRLPVFIWQRHGIYGFPDLGDGIKVTFGALGRQCDPRTVTKEVDDSEWAAIEKVIRDRLPIAVNQRCKSTVCLYTQTMDGDFVIDRHPEMSNVLIVSACSGHGFKHSAAIGELAANLVLAPQESDLSKRAKMLTYDIKPFSFSRFTAADPAPR